MYFFSIFSYPDRKYQKCNVLHRENKELQQQIGLKPISERNLGITPQISLVSSNITTVKIPQTTTTNHTHGSHHLRDQRLQHFGCRPTVLSPTREWSSCLPSKSLFFTLSPVTRHDEDGFSVALFAVSTAEGSASAPSV